MTPSALMGFISSDEIVYRGIRYFTNPEDIGKHLVRAWTEPDAIKKLLFSGTIEQLGDSIHSSVFIHPELPPVRILIDQTHYDVFHTCRQRHLNHGITWSYFFNISSRCWLSIGPDHWTSNNSLNSILYTFECLETVICRRRIRGQDNHDPIPF